MNITTEEKRMNEKKSSERMSDESVMSLKFMQHTLFLGLHFPPQASFLLLVPFDLHSK